MISDKKANPHGSPFLFYLYTSLLLKKQQTTTTMSNQHFQKFAKKKKNSAIKEEFKQAKKKAKKERAAAINQRFEEKRRMKAEGRLPTNQNLHPKEAKVAVSKPKAAGVASPVKTADKENKEVAVKKFAEMPLNKFLAHCGVCSRRDAVEIVKGGKIKVNGNVILEPAFKVTEKDEVIFNGKKLFIAKNLVYILLNKPKDYITTTDDPQGRKTVLQLVKQATTERIYPVGRLDRNTSGVLLLTNDGELTQKLSHPSYNITKLYEAKLDKPLLKADFDKILTGIKLEDGEIKADSLGYVDPKDKSVIGIEIHSGRNRVVRRIFESMGYDVKGLDRVMYATLTKKNVDRGKWRYLSEKEVRLLKYLNASLKKATPKDKKKPADK
ncbi:rRNA pseudouridine synthase [Ferruginibacter lapsinanis]|uniref:pseudouridine synthase n=1 Tax=Ferruginibacter lapsinanis TaxID=563172 RepID=UPI001E4F790A|nr:pseudouridine synthase [Ferruginibacter lapsinanis]UEG50029.1 rRNA pseudouridine synthase [Ferruginibacter lapsinanis]